MLQKYPQTDKTYVHTPTHTQTQSHRHEDPPTHRNRLKTHSLQPDTGDQGVT